MNKTAPFITFEGGEGAGKSTQIKLLRDYLQARGKKIITTREPGATEGGEAIRALLVQGAGARWDAETDTLLFMAARRDHLAKIVWPALARGEWVLCDRFQDSTKAYQGYGRGLDVTHIDTLYRFIAGDFKPDMTLLLDIDPKIGVERALHGKNRATHENRFENFDFSFHEKLRAGYLSMAAAEPNRFVIINADQDVDAVQADIQRAVARLV
jgi:dTMP kinase